MDMERTECDYHDKMDAQSQAQQRIFVIVTLTMSVLVAIGCSPTSQTVMGRRNQAPRLGGHVTQPFSQTSATLAADNSQLGFKLFAELTKQNAATNVVVSPVSVGIALAMAYNGADGDTKQAMARSLDIQEVDLDELNRAYAALKVALERPDPHVQLSIANGLWTKKGITYKPEFIQRNERFYGAHVAVLDFNEPTAPAIINTWVINNSLGKIDRIVEEIDPQSILFLVNAVYFKGRWSAQFDGAKTQQAVFTTADARQIQHPMMHQSGMYHYYEGDGFQAVALPYGVGRISMYIFLPATATNLLDFQKKLTEPNWKGWLKEFVMAEGDIAVPRFRVQYEVALNDALRALGMGLAFDPEKANFSGMVQNSENVFISHVKHKVIVEVTEEGTEASATTAIEMSVTSAPQPGKSFKFIVDRPFVWAIADSMTDTMLFLGSISDPR